MVPSQAEQHRRDGYVYYDETCAELVYSIAVRPNVKGRPRATREALLVRYIRIGCEYAILIPSMQAFYQRVLEDDLSITPVQNMRDRCLAYLTKKGKFDAIRHDGAYKVLMSMTDQPKHGAKMRKSEGEERPGRLHVAHTPTTATGDTVERSAEFGESRQLTLGFIDRSLDVSTSDVRPAEHVCILYSDRVRDLVHVDTLRASPNLDAVASDPLHRCLEIEACPGGRRAALSSALRKIHMKFPPESPSVREDDRRYGAPWYYSRAEKGAKARLRATEEEIRSAEIANWTARGCKKELQALDDDEYIRRPFDSRAEYVTMVMALPRSPEYACHMERRHKDATVETILRGAITPENIEYLPNGSVFLESNFPGEGGIYPVRTTTDEATQ